MTTVKDISKNKIVKFEGDENEERGNWSGKFDFFLSCVGYAVGLGNIWRFPYLCYRNGGGAFLIPYFSMLLIAGIPMFFFELSLGQFSNLGPITVWRIQPMFKGIGYAMLICSAFVSIYYNVIIAWSLYYFFASLTSKLPWSGCNNVWNDHLCTTDFKNVSSPSCSFNITSNCTKYQVAAEQYWERVVLGVTNYNGTTRKMEPFLGEVQWHLCLCLLLAWIICVLILIKGVKSSGKVVYFTAIFPYVVIIIMIINGALLKGSLSGIKYYIIPRWGDVLKAKAWGDAATQIFYSLGIAFGGLMTMSSYNKFNNNCLRDAISVSIINCLTSFTAGFAIFSVLGFISVQTQRTIQDTVASGSGLAFVVYAEGISKMPAAPFFSVLFFLMLFTLGIDSQFANMETIFSGLQDEFPILRRTRWTDITFKCVISLILFFLGIPCVSKSGIYMFTIMDDYSGSISLLVICICEIVVIMYIYGFKTFGLDIKMMLGKTPNIYWIVCWMVLTPVVILFILIISFVQQKPSIYNAYILPVWANVLGWLMAATSIVAIPIGFIHHAIFKGFTKTPTTEWGPGIEKYWNDDPRYLEKLPKSSKGFDVPKSLPI